MKIVFCIFILSNLLVAKEAFKFNNNTYELNITEEFSEQKLTLRLKKKTIWERYQSAISERYRRSERYGNYLLIFSSHGVHSEAVSVINLKTNEVVWENVASADYLVETESNRLILSYPRPNQISFEEDDLVKTFKME